MQVNIGGWERRFRFALAVVVFALAVLPVGPLEVRAMLLPVASGLFLSAWRRSCPLYALLGFTTSERPPHAVSRQV